MFPYTFNKEIRCDLAQTLGGGGGDGQWRAVIDRRSVVARHAPSWFHGKTRCGTRVWTLAIRPDETSRGSACQWYQSAAVTTESDRVACCRRRVFAVVQENQVKFEESRGSGDCPSRFGGGEDRSNDPGNKEHAAGRRIAAIAVAGRK